MENQDTPKEIAIPTHALEDPIFGNLRVSKIVCSRSVKTSHGEVYVGMSMTGEPGLDVRRARPAALRLGLEVERLAFRRAILGRLAPPEQIESLVADIVNDYVIAIRGELSPGAAPLATPAAEGSDE